MNEDCSRVLAKAITYEEFIKKYNLKSGLYDLTAKNIFTRFCG